MFIVSDTTWHLLLSISTLPKNQAAPIEMVINDFLEYPKRFFFHLKICFEKDAFRQIQDSVIFVLPW